MATTTTAIAQNGTDGHDEPTSKPIIASFTYYAAKEPPAEDDIRPFLGTSPNNALFDCPVYSMRPNNLYRTFDISTNGFQILHHQSKLLPPSVPANTTNFHDSPLITSTYYPEIRSLLSSTFSARSVLIVNTTVRDIPTTDLSTFDPKNPRKTPKGKGVAPFFIVHGDYTPPGARSHLRAMLPTFYEATGTHTSTPASEQDLFYTLRNEIIEAEDRAIHQHKEAGILPENADHWDWNGENYEGPRYAMFSIWRPLDVVKRDPLAVMDATSLTSATAIARKYRDRPGMIPEYKSTNLLPLPPSTTNPTDHDTNTGEPNMNSNPHKWYFLPDQTPEEVYAIKLFDSEAQKQASSIAASCAHSAFKLPGTTDDEDSLPLRKSCELRAWVIW